MLLGSTITVASSLSFCLFGCPPVTLGSEVTAAPVWVAGEKGKVILVCSVGPLSFHASWMRSLTILEASPPCSRSLPSASGTVIWITQC